MPKSTVFFFGWRGSDLKLAKTQDPRVELRIIGCLVLAEDPWAEQSVTGCLVFTQDPWAQLNKVGCLVFC